MSLIVLCAGGHARVVIEALLSRGIRPTAVTDRDSARVGNRSAAFRSPDQTKTF